MSDLDSRHTDPGHRSPRIRRAPDGRVAFTPTGLDEDWREFRRNIGYGPDVFVHVEPDRDDGPPSALNGWTELRITEPHAPPDTAALRDRIANAAARSCFDSAGDVVPSIHAYNVADAVLPVVEHALARATEPERERERDACQIESLRQVAGDRSDALEAIGRVLADRGPARPDSDLAAWVSALADDRDHWEDEAAHRGWAATKAEHRAERQRDHARTSARIWRDTAYRLGSDTEQQREAPTRAEVVAAIIRWDRTAGLAPSERVDRMVERGWLIVADEPDCHPTQSPVKNEPADPGPPAGQPDLGPPPDSLYRREPLSETHLGQDPAHGGLTTHRGNRADCLAPDCEDDPDDIDSPAGQARELTGKQGELLHRSKTERIGMHSNERRSLLYLGLVDGGGNITEAGRRALAAHERSK